ncbi:MAG: PilZ domain-containing protein [Pseudomonadales bacterium]
MRRFVRHPTDIPIDVNLAIDRPQPETSSHMTTVSRGGLSCEVTDKITVGCQVYIDIPSVSPAYHGTGEVMWCRSKEGHYEIGVRFTNKAEAYKSRMVQQVCQIEHYKNMVFEKEGRILDGDQAAAEWIEKYAAEFD